MCQWKNTPISNGLQLRYSQCLGQHTSASMCSTLNHVKSRHRSVLTDTRVKELLRVATTEYKPDLKKIVKEKECQNSHGLSNMHDNK